MHHVASLEHVADGPVGPYVARGVVGSYVMLSPCDSDQPVAYGPMGPYVACGPVGSYGILSPCDSDSDQHVADDPWVSTLHVARWARMGRCQVELYTT